jgi:hypothetical protein
MHILTQTKFLSSVFSDLSVLKIFRSLKTLAGPALHPKDFRSVFPKNDTTTALDALAANVSL